LSIDALRAFVNEHSQSVRILTAIAVAMEAKTYPEAYTSAIKSRAIAILKSHNLDDTISENTWERLIPVLASIKADVFYAAKLLRRQNSGTGWDHDDEDLLQAFGDVSTGFPAVLKNAIAPLLDGLTDKLSAPRSRFLDVGTGVGALTIQMLREWPHLHAVGIEPNPHAAEMADRNVAKAGLCGRFLIWEGRAQDFHDDEGFDLIWVPAAFIPPEQLEDVMMRCKRLLRHNGWIIVAAFIEGRYGIDTSIDAFRVASWGGTLQDLKEWAKLLNRLKFLQTKILPGPSSSPIVFIAATV